MNLKRGNIVSHTIAQEWGVGKVVEVNDVRATILFTDGVKRKIASSHFSNLEPADPSLYAPPADKAAESKPHAGRSARKTHA